MMLSSYPFWWLALPVLLLPIWWHRQKRQRLKAEPLATARFLPSAAPEQLRVWKWRDPILLLVRCLMLVALIAWLATIIFPWRGDTVLLDAGADKTWAEQQIAAAGLSSATRIALPADALQWLRRNERDWRDDAKLLIVARADQIAMPARVPQFGHQVELRTAPAATAAPTAASAAPTAAPTAASAAPTAAPTSASAAATAAPTVASAAATAATAPTAPTAARAATVTSPTAVRVGTGTGTGTATATATATATESTTALAATESAAAPTIAAERTVAPAEHRVALAATPERALPWRALFAAFDRAGDGASRYPLAVEPTSGTKLIVWDTPNATPPANWRAPHWWLAAAPAAAFPELANASTLTINGITLKYADSPRGRLWTSDAFPPRDADTARSLYETWQLLQAVPAPAYPTPSQTFAAARNTAPALGDTKPATWLMLALLALFILERILTHARRN